MTSKLAISIIILEEDRSKTSLKPSLNTQTPRKLSPPNSDNKIAKIKYSIHAHTIPLINWLQWRIGQETAHLKHRNRVHLYLPPEVGLLGINIDSLSFLSLNGINVKWIQWDIPGPRVFKADLTIQVRSATTGSTKPQLPCEASLQVLTYFLMPDSQPDPFVFFSP